jgi:hypothetical protein
VNLAFFYKTWQGINYSQLAMVDSMIMKLANVLLSKPIDNLLPKGGMSANESMTKREEVLEMQLAKLKIYQVCDFFQKPYTFLFG